MTNRDLAELRDPERKQAGWWSHIVDLLCDYCSPVLRATPNEECDWKHKCAKCGVEKWADELVEQPIDVNRAVFTGPDWHADDLACFRDWRPVLLAAGCDIWHHEKRTCVRYGPSDVAVDGWGIIACSTLNPDGEGHYRAAILAAVAWLAGHKPKLLRDAIARVEEGA